MEPWQNVVTPRKEVREGRSFNPDEFAIHLEQVVAGTAPEDYRDPAKFFSRTCFTRALREHVGQILRRLAGETASTAPVATLVTQFGGGKTHTLTALYHLGVTGEGAASFDGIPALLQNAGLGKVPAAKVAVFVGNAWDPQPGRETPWIDVARSLAGAAGVEVLGSAALKTPPGTEAIGRVFAAAGGPVLVLFDEVLNFVNRHRDFAEPFHAFLQNLTVAMTATTRGAALISLPRSQVEMTPWDLEWQERITKVVKRVAKDLIANDEAEIGEVVRRRLFENLGDEKVRRKVAKAYADWAFERRAQLPPEWSAVDSGATDAKARQFLQGRFEACYPFHPATLTVFQRKWQTLPQYQQTRGTLAMLAQWVSRALHESVRKAQREPLLGLGLAPLDHGDFRNVVLGQLGEPRLGPAVEADLVGPLAHARALDADTKGPLREIHRRVGTAVFFESSGGLRDKIAHLPELRFAVGGPDLDTTSVDSAVDALERRGYYLRRLGTDGFHFQHQPKLQKVVADRKASLDEEEEVRPEVRRLVKEEFEKGKTLPWVLFPAAGSDVPDQPRLTLVVVEPESEWRPGGEARERLAAWTRAAGTSPRLYPGALLWCLRKPGRELRHAVEEMLAWRRVKREVGEGKLRGFERTDLADLEARTREAEERAREEVWASYRYLVLFDREKPDGLAEIDLGAGHASAGETLCGRLLQALKSQALLNESPGASYLDRKWPEAFRESGAWPLASLRQAFLSGALERVLDPEAYLRARVPQFVEKGEMGLASGQRTDGSYERVWFAELVDPHEIAFDGGVYLLRRGRAAELKGGRPPGPRPDPEPVPTPDPEPPLPPGGVTPPPAAAPRVVRVSGQVSPELWNRLGTRLIPRLRAGERLRLTVELEATFPADQAEGVTKEVALAVMDLGLDRQLFVEEREES
jgi:hypothetical protein